MEPSPGVGDGRHALDTLDHIRDPAFAVFRDYHAGLIADLTGNAPEARQTTEGGL